jgi:hypothetical protein
MLDTIFHHLLNLSPAMHTYTLIVITLLLASFVFYLFYFNKAHNRFYTVNKDSTTAREESKTSTNSSTAAIYFAVVGYYPRWVHRLFVITAVLICFWIVPFVNILMTSNKNSAKPIPRLSNDFNFSITPRAPTSDDKLKCPEYYKNKVVYYDQVIFDMVFDNKRDAYERVSKIDFLIESIEPDNNPYIDFTLRAERGDLLLQIYNSGYGEAKNFDAVVNLGVFHDSIAPQLWSKKLTLATIEGVTPKQHGDNVYLLIEKADIDESKLPNQVNPNIDSSKGLNPILVSGTYAGIKGENGPWKFTKNVLPERSRNNPAVRIFYYGANFEKELAYKNHGFSYDIKREWLASAQNKSYDIKINVGGTENSYDAYIPNIFPDADSNKIDSGQSKKIPIKLSVTKSAIIRGRFSVTLGNGERIESAPIECHIWHPPSWAIG